MQETRSSVKRFIAALAMLIFLGLTYAYWSQTTDFGVSSDSQETDANLLSEVDAAIIQGRWVFGRWWSELSGANRTRLLTERMEKVEVKKQLAAIEEAANTMTLLNNKLLPLRAAGAYKVVSLQDQQFPAFMASASRFAELHDIKWVGRSVPADLPASSGDPVIFLVNSSGIGSDTVRWWPLAQRLARKFQLLIVHFGPEGALAEVDASVSVLHLPVHNEWAEDLAAQALFGAAEINGQLVGNISALFPAGTGDYAPQIRLRYAPPESVGINRHQLQDLDKIMAEAIRRRAVPGAQMLIAKQGRIVFEKAYGHHTYAQEQPVLTTDLYDLASLTKAIGTTLAVMQLYDRKQISLTDRLGQFLGQYNRSPIRRISLHRLLAHQSGLPALLPVSYFTHKKSPLQSVQDDRFRFALGTSQFLDAEVREAFLTKITQTPVARVPGRRYSDINFVLLQQVVESVTQTSLDSLLTERFYNPMGLRRLGYRPTFRWQNDEIVPTVIDKKWRGGLVQGIPHDEGAVLLGGVGGHAGLFGQAADVAAIFQLYLNGGNYNGHTFFSPETVERFIKPNGFNTRATGFERLAPIYPDLIAAGASNATFGHTGFTGVCAWADPEHELIFVFLSNRIYPDPNSRNFYKLRLRRRLHKVVYNALDSWR